MMDLSVIIVNYNFGDLLKNCLKSVYDRIKGISFEVFVVDNASSDGSVKIAEKEFPGVKLIKNRKNFGFAKANNIAAKQSRGRYILLLNPDTIILNDTLQKMVIFMDAHPDAGAVGPKVLNSDGSIQYFHHSEDTYSYPFLFYWFRSHFRTLNSKYVKKRMDKFKVSDRYSGVNKVGYLSGACLMVSRRTMKEGKDLLDERFFMFSEDRDICFEIRKRGYDIYLLPEVSIIHHFGKSYTGNESYQRMLATFFQSQYLFYRKHFGILRATAYRCIIILINTKSLAVYIVKQALICSPFFETQRILQRDITKSIAGILWGFRLFSFK